MLLILETGQALYVLMAACVLSIAVRIATKNLYKRLLKETTNMVMTNNRHLKELKQKAETTYRMNQGIRDSTSWLEHQLNDLRIMGITLAGWNNLANQLTWLCLLLGGGGAFLSYWYRLDSYYIVMYGGGAVLMGMLTMLFDNGALSGKREHLAVALQDYLENVLCPMLAKCMPDDGLRDDGAESVRVGGRNLSRLAERAAMSERATLAERTGPTERETAGAKKAAIGRTARREAAKATAAATAEPERESRRGDTDYLKKSLEQIAASREKSRLVDENWLKDLRPEEVQLLGDILKEYLA